MRCSCCDKELSDSEATAKIVETDGSKPHRYADMCNECLGDMPFKVVRRPVREVYEEPEQYNPFDLDEGGGSEWDDS